MSTRWCARGRIATSTLLETPPRAARDAGHPARQRIRKRIVEDRGWLKTMGDPRTSRRAGRAKSASDVTFALAADTSRRPRPPRPLYGGGPMSQRKPGGRAASLQGRWRIAETDLLDHEALELVGAAFLDIRCEDGGTASSRSGRGATEIGTAVRLVGHVCLHMGDDSGFVHEPW